MAIHNGLKQTTSTRGGLGLIQMVSKSEQCATEDVGLIQMVSKSEQCATEDVGLIQMVSKSEQCATEDVGSLKGWNKWYQSQSDVPLRMLGL